MNDLRTAAMRQAIDALRHGIAKMNHAGFAVECMPLHEAVDALRAALAAEPQPLTDEQKQAALGTAGPDLLELAKRWADNEVHVYQFVNEAERIVLGVVERGAAP